MLMYFILGSILFLDLLGLCCAAAVYLMAADNRHSIEDIKALCLTSISSGKVSQEKLAQFLHPAPPMPGDVQIHIPSILKAHND
jgi:hypothetical protein